MATTEIMERLRDVSARGAKSRYWERHIRVEWGIMGPPRMNRITLKETFGQGASGGAAGPLIPGEIAEKLEAQGITLAGRGFQKVYTGPKITVPEGIEREIAELNIGSDWSFVRPLPEPPPWLMQQPTIIFSDEWEWYWPAQKKRYMEFEASFEKDGTSNSAELKVWNLSDETLGRYYEALKEAGIGHDSEEQEMTDGFIPFVRIYAGYGDWLPLIFTGKIKSIPETTMHGADKVTKFLLIDDEESRLPRWRCPGGEGSYFPPGTMMSEVVRRLIADLGIPLGAPIELGVDYPTKSGISYGPNKSIREALRELAQETASVMYLVNSHIYFVPKWYGIPTGLKINKKSGLIWMSRPVHYPRWGGTEEVVFTSILNPLLTLDALVEVEDAHFSGTVRIEAVNIRINRDDYYCECRGVIFDEEAARKEREEEAKMKLAELNRDRKIANLPPLQLEGFVIRNVPPPPEPEEPQEERPMPYWDEERQRWVDPAQEE